MAGSLHTLPEDGLLLEVVRSHDTWHKISGSNKSGQLSPATVPVFNHLKFQDVLSIEIAA